MARIAQVEAGRDQRREQDAQHERAQPGAEKEQAREHHIEEGFEVERPAEQQQRGFRVQGRNEQQRLDQAPDGRDRVRNWLGRASASATTRKVAAQYAGTMRSARRLRKRPGRNAPSPAIMVIMKPLMTKNTSTPSRPVFSKVKFSSPSGHCSTWVMSTLSAAKARKYWMEIISRFAVSKRGTAGSICPMATHFLLRVVRRLRVLQDRGRVAVLLSKA